MEPPPFPLPVPDILRTICLRYFLKKDEKRLKQFPGFNELLSKSVPPGIQTAYIYKSWETLEICV